MEVGRDSLWIVCCGNGNGSTFSEADKSRDSLPQEVKKILAERRMDARSNVTQ